MGQISQQLTRSDLSIALISSSYLNSEYCKKELRLMLNAQMEGELRFFPIKLHRESLELPEYMNDVHYLRRWEHNSMEAVAKFITKTFDEEAKAAVDKVIITGS
jgi:TIR domain